jgi:hypothetical protein
MKFSSFKYDVGGNINGAGEYITNGRTIAKDNTAPKRVTLVIFITALVSLGYVLLGNVEKRAKRSEKAGNA